MPDSAPPPARALVVLRHAKAEQSGPTDFERRLSDSGRADAAAAGAWLAGRGIAPDAALVSAAVRAEETWDAVAGGAGWDLAPTLDRGLYAADPDTAIDALSRLDEQHRTVVVVGHNPTMASLALLLDDGEGDADAGVHLATGFPTCALAVFTYRGRWADLAPGVASISAFHVARA